MILYSNNESDLIGPSYTCVRISLVVLAVKIQNSDNCYLSVVIRDAKRAVLSRGCVHTFELFFHSYHVIITRHYISTRLLICGCFFVCMVISAKVCYRPPPN